MRRVLTLLAMVGVAVLAAFVPEVLAQEAAEAEAHLGELAKFGLAIGDG